MKALLLGVLLAVSQSAICAEDVVAIIKQEAQNCAKAALTSDYDTIVRYTHPRIVKGMGGKEAMIGVLKSGMSQMHADGAEFLDVTIGKPEDPKKIGAWITSIVPQHQVLKVRGGKLYSDATLLGISEDNGKHWVFIDLGPVSKEQFGQVFPELAGKITMPEKKPPVFKKDDGA